MLDPTEIFAGNDLALPLVTVDYDKIYNQAIERDPSTQYACGSCASHWVVNAMNHAEGSSLYLDWVDSRNEQLED